MLELADAFTWCQRRWKLFGTTEVVKNLGVLSQVHASKEFSARIEKTGGGVQYLTPAEFCSMIERDKNTALEIAKKEGLAQAPK